jgi:hypothetical protein
MIQKVQDNMLQNIFYIVAICTGTTIILINSITLISVISSYLNKNQEKDGLSELQYVFDDINYAISHKESDLEIDIDSLDNDLFAMLFHGLRQHYPSLGVDLKTHSGTRKEYLLVKTQHYTGPKNKLISFKPPTYSVPKVVEAAPPVSTINSRVINLRNTTIRNLHLVSNLQAPIREGNVINLDAFRSRKEDKGS